MADIPRLTLEERARIVAWSTDRGTYNHVLLLKYEATLQAVERMVEDMENRAAAVIRTWMDHSTGLLTRAETAECDLAAEKHGREVADSWVVEERARADRAERELAETKQREAELYTRIQYVNGALRDSQLTSDRVIEKNRALEAELAEFKRRLAECEVTLSLI